MQLVDLVLKNGKIATSSGIFEAGIAIDGEKIVAIAKDDALPKADLTIDMKHNVALPGIIDSHVHVCTPEGIRETFETGTKAAAAGGVTTIIEMPSLWSRLTTTMKNLQWKKQTGEKQAFVDFALYGGEIQDEKDLNEIEDLIKAGVVGFKITMGGRTAIKDDATLMKALQKISKMDSTASFHAENNSLLKYFKTKLMDEGRNDLEAHADSRPPLIEVEAISRAILYSKISDSKIHICHLTTKEGVKLVERAKRKGIKITSETCPHFLFFTREDYSQYGPSIITNPPLRSKHDVEALWNGLAKGTVDIIVTDHCAYSKKEKEIGWTDVWKTPVGIPGLETLVCLLLSEGVNKKRITLERFVQISSETPAKIFGLYPKKGTIRVGSDADITIIDLKKENVISGDKLQCVADYTPFEGWKVRGWPILSLVRGKIVMENGEIKGRSGFGKFIPSRQPIFPFANNVSN